MVRWKRARWPISAAAVAVVLVALDRLISLTANVGGSLDFVKSYVWPLLAMPTPVAWVAVPTLAAGASIYLLLRTRTRAKPFTDNIIYSDGEFLERLRQLLVDN